MSGLSRVLARKILAQMGENGKPPELGISHVNVGNESYLELLDRAYIDDVVMGLEGSSFKLVQGTYGAGKTHFLTCVRDLAWARGLLTAQITLSAKECPFNKPLGVYRAVAQRIELPPTEDGEISRGIDDVLRRTVEDKVAADGEAATRAWAALALARAPLSQHSFRDAAVRYVEAVLAGDRESMQRLAAWLRGEAVPVGVAKAEGLFDVPSNENGFAMLRSLVQVVHRLGHGGCVLLFDEAERRMSVEARPTKATQETIEHLREIVDLCGRSELPRTLILYAVTPAFTQSILPLYPALQQRLGAPLQYLSPHNPKAPLIDLEALDLGPRKLLSAMGLRLVKVAQQAYEWKAQEAVLRANLTRLVDTVAEEQLEVSHRRLFVKLWIRHLDELRLGGERRLDDVEIRALVRDEQAQLLAEVDPSAPAMTFFGEPVPSSKKPRRSRRAESEPGSAGR